MGNHASAHQPLERAAHQRHSFRFSKRERSPGKRMDRLRRSFRDSFRRRKEPHSPESSKPHQWQADESGVRSGTCNFQVKYLGCVEVYESRGMQVCEEALKVLRSSRKRPVRAILYVSGDGLRVVEDETKGLIVDQTIEKVSFCAPDRNHDKGFSYICRDGTTRRWMCHGFLATKETGERLSHAVGCAFAACLERKQRRDKECGVTMTFDQKTSTFTRSGSFRQPSLTERLHDSSRERAIDVPPSRQVYNPFAIERPHATASMLERQGSFRGFNQLNQASPFKRQLSLRVNDLPSNLERARSHSLEPTDLSRMPFTIQQQIPIRPPVSPIPEVSPSGQDNFMLANMAKQISRDIHALTLNTKSDDFNPIIGTTSSFVRESFGTNTTSFGGVTNSSSMDELQMHNGHSLMDMVSSSNNNATELGNNMNNNSNTSNNNNNILMSSNDESGVLSGAGSDGLSWQESSSSVVSSTTNNHRITPILDSQCSLSPVLPARATPAPPIASVFETPAASPAFSHASTSSLSSAVVNRSPVPLPPSSLADSPHSSLVAASPTPAVPHVPVSVVENAVTTSTTSAIPVASVQPLPSTTNLPKPEQWLGSVTTQATASHVPTPVVAPRRAPPLHSRALSLGSAAMSTSSSRAGPSDPFDAEWAEIAARRQASTTNPFIVPNTTQAFQVQL